MKRLFPMLVVTTIATPALAFGPGGHGPHGHHDPGARLERALDEVDATDVQRETIQDILADLPEQLKSFHEQGKELRLRMQDAFRAEVVDRNVVEEIRLEGIDLADRVSSTVLDLMVEAGNVLTAEQRNDLIDAHEARKDERRERIDGFRERIRERRSDRAE